MMKVVIHYNSKPFIVPMLVIYKDSEKILTYYEPEKRETVVEKLKKAGLEKWEIDEVLSIIKTVSIIIER